MDTVRAESLSLYGYERQTTPNLERWSKQGVRFDHAIAPAPWTLPSHCSFLTGQWPSKLNAHWRTVLDPAYPTLAEFLRARGYWTAGFISNTYWCSYESGMNRGFLHYEDYPLTLHTMLGSTVPGRWIVEHALLPSDYYSVKWIRSQSRDAGGINRAFLDWLSDQPAADRRPFFAFLNYLDAHEPFVPPSLPRQGRIAPFGLRPESRGEHRMLLDYWDRNKLDLSPREVALARDAYDDCLAALDQQVGALLDELEHRGVLSETLVIITSDHGEEFGEHGVFNHGFSLYAPAVHVPLLVLSRTGRPGGKAISEPVSLRDLPATVVDLLGLADGAPFPGRSLAALWRPAPAFERSPALSEVDIPTVIDPRRGRGARQRGFTMSLVNGDHHYLVDINGVEELYDLERDSKELRDLKKSSSADPSIGALRRSLLAAIAADPVTAGVAAAYLARLRATLESLIAR
jgi:arylsulfatase A-like enzyme